MKQIYILADNDYIIAAYTHRYAAEREAKHRQNQEEELHKRYGGKTISQKHFFHVVVASFIEGE